LTSRENILEFGALAPFDGAHDIPIGWRPFFWGPRLSRGRPSRPRAL